MHVYYVTLRHVRVTTVAVEKEYALHNLCRALVGKPKGRRPRGRSRRRWEDNIKMDLREGWGGAWTGSIWLRIGTGGELL
jgi:hypothetical protein